MVLSLLNLFDPDSVKLKPLSLTGVILLFIHYKKITKSKDKRNIKTDKMRKIKTEKSVKIVISIPELLKKFISKI